MSEFLCKNGHEMRGPRCSICGGKVHTMDGYTDREIERMEADYENKQEKESEEE
jgi:hypothetical protein